MLCLIAAEKSFAEKIRENLKGMARFKDWEMEICSSAWSLEEYQDIRPDVLLLSPNLPGEDPSKLIKHIPVMFSTSHIVLLVGKLDEKAKLYIRAAQNQGLVNYVTGNLPDHPGDRPYNLPTAMTSNREGGLINSEEPPENTYQAPIQEYEETNVENREQSAPRNPIEKPEEEVIVSRSSLRKTPNFLAQRQSTTLGFNRNVRGTEGALVVTAANKGGVGKTTTAVTVSVALANAGVNVIVVDLDLGSPNLKGFFQVEPSRGIEALSGRTRGILPFVEQLLVEIPKYENIRLLPGPIDKTILPEEIFEPGELGALIKILRQMVPVVIADTPAEFWTRHYLTEVFEQADTVLAVVDQSKFSVDDTRDYAPYLISMGALPDKIRIVVNKFSPKLHNVKNVEKAFCAGFKQNIPAKDLPRVASTIPHDWDAHGLKGYRGEVVGLEDPRSQWHKLAAEIAAIAGHKYQRPEIKKTGKSFFGLFKKQ